MNETRKPRTLLAVFAFAALAGSGCSEPAAEPPLKGAAIGGPFALTDQNGRQVTDRDLRGKYPIVYFGFTHCPDVCPTDLAAIGQALALFEKQDPSRAAKVQPVFISVDPERDTPAALKEYVSAFHPRLIGLTGTPGQIAQVAKEYRIWFAKGEAQRGGGYSVNHMRLAFLLGPDGAPILMLPSDQGPKAVAAELDRWVT